MVRAYVRRPLGEVGGGHGVAQFGERVGLAAEHVARSAAAAVADGARPSTVPPASVQARASTAIAVVLPVPAGARAELQPGRGSGQLPRHLHLPGGELHAVRGGLQQRHLDRARVDGVPVVALRRGDQRLFGGQDARRGVQLGTGDLVHAGAVQPAQLVRVRDAVREADRDAVPRKGGGNQPVDRVVQVGDRQGSFADQAERFGAHVPDLPGGACGLDRRDDLRRGRLDPALVRLTPRATVPVEGAVEHCVDGLGGAEFCDRLGPPRGALLGVRPWLVFGVAGLQVRLLRQRDRLHRRRRPMVFGLEPCRQHRLPVLNVTPPRGPADGQPSVDPVDLSHRSLALRAAGAFGERDPEPVTQMGLQPGVVVLGRGDLGLVQHPSVQRQPPPVPGLHLVADRQMGVQVRVAGTRVAVGERRREQPADRHLPHPGRALPGERDLAFQPAQGVRHRSVMRRLDLRRDRSGGDRPQRADALHRAERQVVPGHRGGRLSGLAGDEPGQLAAV